MKRFNWQIWAGFLVAIFAFLSYPIIFVNWEITRDFPWANVVLFAIALGLLFVGIRRVFQPGRRLISKIIGPVLATLSVGALGMFIFVAFVASRWLPASTNAPQVGQKAPEFSLVDTNKQNTSLSQLLSEPIPSTREVASGAKSEKPKGVLLIFYRGYW